MAVFRVEKNKNYTIMSNYHLKEKEMSLKAKGLLSVMLSLPEDWDFTINGLVAICKENETAVKSTLTELKKFGYLKVDKLTPKQTESGRFEYIYNIFEMPKQEYEKQGVENLYLESLSVENQGQLNTNKLNTNKLNTKNRESARFIPPTLEEIEEYAKSRNSNVDAKQFYEYFNTGNWVDSKGNKVKNWKQKFLTWEGHQTPTYQKKENKKLTQSREYTKEQLDSAFSSLDDLW